MNTGDIVRVTRNDGRIYDCFVIEEYKNYQMFYGRVLESSRDKVPSANWKRYGLIKENGICQLEDECESIELLSTSTCKIIEDLNDTRIYETYTPDGKKITFCLSEDYGGWSDEDDEDTAIVESYTSSMNNRKEG